jgi:GAF domain-containing protein
VFVVKDEAIITQDAPAANQPSFQQLLAAAFIVQEHNDKLQSAHDPDAAYTRTLAEIVETERLIQDPRVDFHTALELIAERAHTITRADGVALGLLENGKLVYCADTGEAGIQLNAPALITATLSAECFRTGKALQSEDSLHDDRVDEGLCHRLGVASLLAVPVREEGKIAGVLELRYKRPNGFTGPDLRTLQLMSGLAGEVLAKKSKQGWKQALASSEEAAVRSVLDQIQPELDRFEENDEEFDRAVSNLTAKSAPASRSIDLTEVPAVEEALEEATEEEDKPQTTFAPLANPSADDRYTETLCARCGHAFAADEAFCVLCGAMRSEDSPVVLTPKTPTWTSLWDMQDAEAHDIEGAPKSTARRDAAAEFDFDDKMVSRLSDEPDLESDLSENTEALATREWERGASWKTQDAAFAEEEAKVPEPLTELPPESWFARMWREQRPTLYVAAAFGVLALVIVNWIMQPAAPVAASPAPVAESLTPRTELSMMEKMLVGLGLAEAPSKPVYKGDPQAKVWEDLHTALYYCEGSDFFGKTKGGRYATQREAQLDQFQPASRKVCE